MEENKTYLNLKPKDMNSETMDKLERMGLIYRLCPGNDELTAEKGQTSWKTIYECDTRYGPHKLIAVTVNRERFEAFGSHPDNEDFLLIGDPDTKPMFLLIALSSRNELEKKIKNNTLKEDDFILLKVKYNDPEVSFFSMLKDIPHGEASAPGEGKPGSFYVTESRDLNTDLINLGNYEIRIV